MDNWNSKTIKINGQDLVTKTPKGEIADQVRKIYTIEADDQVFKTHDVELPGDYNLGVIVGESGSGKSLLLNEIGKEEEIVWNNEPICEAFDDVDDLQERLFGCGLASIPAWLLPFNKLSNGQQYRASTARRIKDFAVFDEFSSVIDRETAISISDAIGKYIRKNNVKNITIATPHHDIIPYLKPDWVYNTNERKLYLNGDSEKIEVPEGEIVLEYEV